MYLSPLIFSILTMLGLLAISAIKGNKATKVYHFAIAILAFGSLALYEMANYPFSIFFDTAMTAILIYEITEIQRSKTL